MLRGAQDRIGAAATHRGFFVNLVIALPALIDRELRML